MSEDRALWDLKAEFWDALHGDEGNDFHRTLVSPAVEGLLALRTGERVLDIACGSGVLARRLAALGGVVTAVDFSAALVERAKARGQAAGTPITYGVADATDEDALVACGEGSFDAITCTMALMDMPEIAPLFRAVRRLLGVGGRLVIVTAHPAFNSANPVFYAELEDRAGALITTAGVKIARYLDALPVKAVGAVNEPAPHMYYHRPLYALLGEAFAAGLVVDGMDERGYTQSSGEPPRLLSWRAVPQIPPVLAARFRVGSLDRS